MILYACLVNVGIGLLVGALSLPLVMEKVSMNRFYGVRFRQSYASEENWRRINKAGGKYLLFWSVVVMAVGLLLLVWPASNPDALARVAMFAPLLLVVAAIQSWHYARTL